MSKNVSAAVKPVSSQMNGKPVKIGQNQICDIKYIRRKLKAKNLSYSHVAIGAKVAKSTVVNFLHGRPVNNSQKYKQIYNWLKEQNLIPKPTAKKKSVTLFDFVQDFEYDINVLSLISTSLQGKLMNCLGDVINSDHGLKSKEYKIFFALHKAAYDFNEAVKPSLELLEKFNIKKYLDKPMN